MDMLDFHSPLKKMKAGSAAILSVVADIPCKSVKSSKPVFLNMLKDEYFILILLA